MLPYVRKKEDLRRSDDVLQSAEEVYLFTKDIASVRGL